MSASPACTGAQQVAHPLGRVGVVAVDHDVQVGLHAAQQGLHGEALALSRLFQDDGPVGGGDGGGVVGDSSCRLRRLSPPADRAEIVHDLADGGGLVVEG